MCGRVARAAAGFVFVRSFRQEYAERTPKSSMKDGEPDEPAFDGTCCRWPGPRTSPRRPLLVPFCSGVRAVRSTATRENCSAKPWFRDNPKRIVTMWVQFFCATRDHICVVTL
jgi:hypothetical protein